MARVQYREILCKSALNRVEGMPFRWSLNPYRGCAHACHYCYARASHTFYDMNGDEDFETKILVKVNFAEVLAKELGRRSWIGEQVAMGTVTDCYQPAEGRFRVTRRTLETLLTHRNPMSMVTKSPMILRDLDILAALAKIANVRISFTITTVDTALWRKVEPGTANPFKRLHVMRLLNKAGVPAGVLLAPILPGITDSVESIEAVTAAAREHGAAFLDGTALRLAPVVKEHYLGFIGGSFPHLLPRYELAYPGTYAPRVYTDKLQARLDRIRDRYGFKDGYMRMHRVPLSAETASAATARAWGGGQLALPL